MNTEWLRTLVAVIDEGSFEVAADELGVTPSAVSQRIKALEARVGQAVVVRTLPCRSTAAGEQLLRMARQVLLLQDESLSQLRHDAGSRLSLAVNADSLATWFRPVLATAAAWPGVTLRLEVEDQEHSAELLRRGDVMGAVTSDPTPVSGCRTEPLGAMRYLPCAALSLLERLGQTPNDIDWATLPALRYGDHDDLQLAFLRAAGVTTPPPQPQVPGSEAFLAGVVAGLGWGLVPELQMGSLLDDGALVCLPGDSVDVALHWQAWRIESATLTRAADAIRAAARPLRRISA